MRIALTGGGTGGHVLPALAVGLELAARGHEVYYVGTGGIEAELVPEKLPFFRVPAGKLDRTAWRPGELVQTAKGILASLALARRLRPHAVFATGGYAAFPFALAARLVGAKLFLHEQNASMGLANRLLRPLAKEVFLTLAIPGVRGRVVGMPILERRYAKAEARTRLGLDPKRLTLLVLGGSRGARVFNREAPKLLAPFLDRIQVLHVSGRGRLAEVHRPGQGYHAVEFVEGPLAWSAADLALTRAGAVTLAEAAFHRVPLILVPYPYAADDHQRKNALRYVEAGAAQMVEEAEIGTLPSVLKALLRPEVRARMAEALAALDPQGSATKIARTIEEVA